MPDIVAVKSDVAGPDPAVTETNSSTSGSMTATTAIPQSRSSNPTTTLAAPSLTTTSIVTLDIQSLLTATQAASISVTGAGAGNIPLTVYPHLRRAEPTPLAVAVGGQREQEQERQNELERANEGDGGLTESDERGSTTVATADAFNCTLQSRDTVALAAGILTVFASSQTERSDRIAHPSVCAAWRTRILARSSCIGLECDLRTRMVGLGENLVRLQPWPCKGRTLIS